MIEPINNNTEPRRLDGATGETQLRAVTAERDALAAALAERDVEVRKTPSWPRSWANFSLL